jgi:multicomponent Na+:H+ antiporter subunit B
LAAALRRLSEARYLMLAAVGIAIYSGLGFLCMLLGQNFLDYGVLEAVFRTDGPEMARSHSMLGVEIGVAATVMAIMFAIYANLASKGTLKKAL